MKSGCLFCPWWPSRVERYKTFVFLPPAEWLPGDLVVVLNFREGDTELTLDEYRTLLVKELTRHWLEGDRIAFVNDMAIYPNGPSAFYEDLDEAVAGLQSMVIGYGNSYLNQLTLAQEHLLAEGEEGRPSYLLLTMGKKGYEPWFHVDNVVAGWSASGLVPSVYCWDFTQSDGANVYDYVRAHDFFLRELVAWTNGSYLRGGSVSERLSAMFETMQPSASELLHLGLGPSAGFSYHQCDFGNYLQGHQTRTIRQVGKLAGTGDLNFRANMLIDGEPAIVIQPVTPTMVTPYTMDRIWWGQRLLHREKLADLNPSVA